MFTAKTQLHGGVNDTNERHHAFELCFNDNTVKEIKEWLEEERKQGGRVAPLRVPLLLSVVIRMARLQCLILRLRGYL